MSVVFIEDQWKIGKHIQVNGGLGAAYFVRTAHIQAFNQGLDFKC